MALLVICGLWVLIGFFLKIVGFFLEEHLLKAYVSWGELNLGLWRLLGFVMLLYVVGLLVPFEYL